MKRIIAVSTLLILASVMPSHATLFVRELWDNVTNGTPVALGSYPFQGQTNGTTSYGFLGNTAPWNVNPADPAATNALLASSSQDVYGDYVKIYPDLPSTWTTLGSLFLAQPNTNGWDSGTWATRLMASSATIHLNSNSTNYFAFRWVKRSFYYPVSGTNGYGEDDAGLGVGFANGNASGSTFLGIGVTRTVKRNTYSGTGYVLPSGADIGDTPYITAGTLGQAGYPGHPGDSGGPYYVQAYAGDGSGFGVTNQCEGYLGGYPISTNTANQYMWGGIMVGRIVTTSGGNTEIDVKNYSGSDTVAFAVDTTPNPVTGWDAIYHFTSTANLNYLLVWMYGNNHANPCQIDGIRVANTWAEILGQEAETPTITPGNPTNTYYQGTPLTFNEVASIDVATNGWYEWLYNSNATLGASAVGIGSNSFVLPNPLVANSGYYSVAFSNNWDGTGLLVTSSPVYLTIVAPSAPIVSVQPQPNGRYLAPGAASFSFNVSVLGTPPFTYRWYQITAGGATNLLASQITNNPTSSFVLNSPIQTSMAGSYFVTVSNSVPPFIASSIPAAFSVIVPTPGSYAAQVVSNNPWAYWRLDENYGTTNLHDYYGGHDGAIVDPTNTVVIGTNPPVAGGVFQDVPAAPSAGFPPNHVGLNMPLSGQGLLARVDMPGLGNYTSNMTWMLWLYSPGPNANIYGEHGFMVNRDYSGTSAGASGYGNAFGLTFFQYVPTPGTTNNNQLGYRWGGVVENPSAQWEGYIWPSGLYVPLTNWTFVAMVWNGPNHATMYMGTNSAPLTVASATLPANLDSAYPGSSYSNSYSMLLGRGGYPWGEGQGNAFDNANVSMSDVAIFTNSLSSNNVYQIYLAATSELITYTNSAGNLVLSWPVGTLLSSTNVLGPYSAVGGAASPYTVSKSVPRQFYRVQK